MKTLDKNKLHNIALKYSEDSAKIKGSMRVIKIGFINNILKELEDLKNRSCKSCKFLHQDYLCLELGDGIKPQQLGLDYCSKWESK